MRKCAPTLAVVSVRLFNVVDLPLEGLPTRAISGSRGIVQNITEKASILELGGRLKRDFQGKTPASFIKV
jgi:hypothetical protein